MAGCCSSEWQLGVGSGRVKEGEESHITQEFFLEPFRLDNPRIFTTMICTG